MILKDMNTFLEIAKKKNKKNAVIAAAEDEPVLKAIQNAVNENIINPIFVGNKTEIQKIANKIEFDISKFDIINEMNPSKSASIAVKIVKDNQAEILIKGFVSTPEYLRAILNKETGIRKVDMLSHLAFFDVPAYHKLIAVSDVALNVAPDINEKITIIKNSVDYYHSLGVENPKIALLAALEEVNPKMMATMDAAAITMMYRRNQIKGCLIDGPLAFDNAVSLEAAHHKKLESPVAGDVDLLLAHCIEVGNALYKAFTYFSNSSVAGIILGASVPVVLTSRADTDRSKLISIALAACN